MALTLSDAFCVDRHRDDFRALIKEGADIVFANEKEITSLYEVNSFQEAADRALADCELAVLTRSEEGSVILTAGETVSIKAAPVPDVVDVTGAGDLYAAGFLYGLTRGAPLEACGALGQPRRRRGHRPYRRAPRNLPAQACPRARPARVLSRPVAFSSRVPANFLLLPKV